MPGSDDDTREIRPQDLETRELAAARRRGRSRALLLVVPLAFVCFLLGYAAGRRRERSRLPRHAPATTTPAPHTTPEAARDAPLPPPAIHEVSARGEPTRVVIRLAQPADPASAAAAAHYAIDQGVEVLAAALDPDDRRTVTLTTSPLAEGTTYTLTIRGVRPALRPLEPKAKFTFTSGHRVRDGLVVLYDLDEGQGTAVKDRSGVGEPLDLAFKDDGKARWIPGGLAIDSATTILSAGPATKVCAACRATNAFTIEAWLRPANLTQGGPARIVTLSRDPNHRLFTLGQHHAAYHVRFRTTATGANGDSPTLEAADCATTELCHVAYTRDRTGIARFYLNGVQRTTTPILGDLSNWEDGMRFALANELTFDRPWLGELHLVAIYARALSPAEIARNHEAGPKGKTARPGGAE